MTGAGPSPDGRIHSLDAVRGIAAFAVLIAHCWSVLTDATRELLLPGAVALLDWSAASLVPGLRLAPRNTPLGLLENARPAVMIFFVLSGYVLTLSLLSRSRPGYGTWVLRRLCRIWLPFAASILVAVLLWQATWSPSLPGFNEWANDIWDDPPTPTLVAEHLLMLGIGWHSKSLNTPMWSLIYELRIALIMPLLVLLAARPAWLLPLLGAALLAASPALLAVTGAPPRPYVGDTLLQSLAVTVHFIPPFIIGVLLARHAGPIGRAIAAAPIALRGLGWVLGFLLLMRWADAPSALGAGLLIALVVHGEFAPRLLGGPVFGWLGRVSYSLYLIHMPVLMAMLHALDGLSPPWVIILAVIPVSLVAAEVLWRLAEAPAIRLGRRIGAPAPAALAR